LKISPLAQSGVTPKPIKHKKAMLLQGEPRDAAVNFDMYRILQ